MKFAFPGNKELCANGNLLGKGWKKELNWELEEIDDLRTR